MASHRYAAVIRRTDRILRQIGSTGGAARSAARTRAGPPITSHMQDVQEVASSSDQRPPRCAFVYG